ncbi:MAG: hypothetical protein IPK75_19005 [Acidobacteria bacterium]|nr:hypothetical protein [Acidobacteriota bacterium]
MRNALYGPTPPPDEPRQDAHVMAMQMDRYVRSTEALHRWSETAIRCLNYRHGEQWLDSEKAEDRPSLTINRVAPLVNMIDGYFRQNRYDIIYKPGGLSPGTDDVATTLTKLEKAVSTANQGKWHAAEVFNDGVSTGRGYFGLPDRFLQNDLGEIKETVLDPFHVRPDPDADDYDPATWNYVQIDSWLSLEDIAATYGQLACDLVDMSSMGGPARTMNSTGGRVGLDQFQPPRGFKQLEGYLAADDLNSTWNGVLASAPWDHINRTRRLLRTIETQHRVWTGANVFIDQQSGAKRPCPVWWDREHIDAVLQWSQLRGLPITIRAEKIKLVRMTVSAGDVVLHDEWSPYRSLTVVPYFAYFRKGLTRGIVNDLLDPQDEVNKRRSVYLHMASSTANSGWQWERGSLTDEMESRMENEGARPGLNVVYERGYQPPTKIQPGAPAQALERLELAGKEDIKEIANINDSALGQLDRVQSGRAIIARQRTSIIGNEYVFDNFSRSRYLCGRLKLELFQDHYTEQRLMMLEGDTGSLHPTMINQRLANGTIANDITGSTYDVTVDERPMADTFAEAQMGDLLDIVDKGIVPGALIADIIVDASSMPRKDEIKRRIDAMMQMQVADMQAAGQAAGMPPGEDGGPAAPEGTGAGPALPPDRGPL